MKVKKLFLSMFAIAALAGCSQSEDALDAPVAGSADARVTLKLEGDGPGSRTAGATPAEANEKAINNLSVFIFNKKSGGLVASKYFAAAAISSGSVSVNSKTDGDKVVVIANAADTQTEFDNLFKTVTSLPTLRAIKLDLLNTDISNPALRTIKQSSGKVLQNGWADITYDSGENRTHGNATVKMRFVGARIAVSSISFNGVNTGLFEPSPDIFVTNKMYNFTIKAIYLMDVNTSTHLIPTLAGTTPASPENPTGSVITVNNDYVDLADRAFGCFEDMAVAPWLKTGSQTLSNDLGIKYTTANKPTVTGTQGTTQTISNPAWWYVFANPTTTANRPTILVVKVGWLKGKSTETYPGTTNPLVDNEREDRYFTVYLDGIDKANIESGKTYNIALKLNGNFLPASGNTGGTGGGGTIDPGTPSADGSVSVTVTTSTWRTVGLEKEWLN